MRPKRRMSDVAARAYNGGRQAGLHSASDALDQLVALLACEREAFRAALQQAREEFEAEAESLRQDLFDTRVELERWQALEPAWRELRDPAVRLH